jgi:HAD superfamily hydrolase (TIGR01509 family)
MTHFKTFLAISLFVSALCAQKPELNTFASQSTEFAWDCHHVLLKPRIGSMIKIGILEGTPKVIGVAASLCYETVRYCLNGAPNSTYQLLAGIRTKLQTKNVTAEDFKALLDNYDSTLWPIALKILSQYKVNTGMQEIVNQLHALGYMQRAATNMSVAEFGAACTQNPPLFECFQDDNMTIQVCENNFPRKPSVHYFHKYQERFNADGVKTIIFIDDKLKNVEAARLAGMYAIHFKNAQQLRDELCAMGINLP